MDDARAAGVDIFTMGQYLQPTKKHLPVVEFVDAREVRALGAPRRKQGLSSGRLEPALAQLLPRGAGLLRFLARSSAQPRVPALGWYS